MPQTPAPHIAPEPPGDPRARAIDGVRALIDQLEAETATLADLRRRADAAELMRLRLEQALDALLPTLPPHEAQAARARMRDVRRGAATAEARARAAPTAAIVQMLASVERPVVQVAEVQRHLTDSGFALRRTYAAGALSSLAQQGYLLKTGHGRYRVNRSHPELVALRLAALEAALSGWE